MAVKVCGFSAVRCILVLLNSVYVVSGAIFPTYWQRLESPSLFFLPQGLSLFLLGLVVAAWTLAYNFANVKILIGVAVVAAFLFLVAVLGLIGTLRHNQIIMFFVSFLLSVGKVDSDMMGACLPYSCGWLLLFQVDSLRCSSVGLFRGMNKLH